MAKGHFFFRLNNLPVPIGKTPAGNMVFRSLPKYTPRGLPDVVLIHKGSFCGIEFKRVGESLSDAQVECARRIILAGGQHHVVRSIDDLQKLGL